MHFETKFNIGDRVAVTIEPDGPVRPGIVRKIHISAGRDGHTVQYRVEFDPATTGETFLEQELLPASEVCDECSQPLSNHLPIKHYGAMLEKLQAAKMEPLPHDAILRPDLVR